MQLFVIILILMVLFLFDGFIFFLTHVFFLVLFSSKVFSWLSCLSFFKGQTSYLLQGSFMKLKLSDHFTMPAASLYLFEITMLLILIPVVDRIIYPMLRHFGVDFTPLKKMGVGMLFAMGSVIVAGLMEIQRKRFIATHGYFQQHPFNTPVNASQMNIFYQVPQYVLMGTGEVLTSIPGKSKEAR